MARLEITVDKARDYDTAEKRAIEIADAFYGVQHDYMRNYQLEQVEAQPKQQTLVTLADGEEIPVGGETTFWVTFIARRLT